MTEPTVRKETFHRYGQLLRRRWGIVAVCMVVVPAAALVWSLASEKEYSASANLLFKKQVFDEELFGNSVTPPSSDPSRDAATNVQLVKSSVVAGRTARAMGGAWTAEKVASAIDVAPEGVSSVVSIKATDAQATVAARLANTYAQQFTSFRRRADSGALVQANALVRARLASLQASPTKNPTLEQQLQARSEELQTLAALQTGDAQIVQPATIPDGPSSPRPVRNTIVALLIGLLLGVGAAAVADRIDRRVRDTHELEGIYGMPVLGVVPQVAPLRPLKGVTEIPSGQVESVSLIRANLQYFDASRSTRSIAVSSALPGEGKSTVALNLAAVAAARGLRVILVDCDLRHPAQQRLLPLRGKAGLGAVLGAGRPYQDLVERIVLEVPSASSEMEFNGVNARELTVLPAGSPPPNPTELIESDSMVRLVRQLESDYDLVILDSPPVGMVAEAVALLSRASGVIIIARPGVTLRPAAHRLRAQLDQLQLPLLGLVVNGAGTATGYGYGYGYTDRYHGAAGIRLSALASGRLDLAMADRPTTA